MKITYKILQREPIESGVILEVRKIEFCCRDMAQGMISRDGEFCVSSASVLVGVVQKATEEDIKSVFSSQGVILESSCRQVSICPWCGEKIEIVLE